eukprot:282563_1
MALHWNTVSCLVLYPLLLPLHVYGSIKWYKYRHHSLFRYRYSLDSAAITLILFILLHFNIINFILSDLNLITHQSDTICGGIIFSLWWIVFSMIYYRINLIFITWKMYRSQFNIIKQNDIPNAEKVDNFLPMRRYCSSQFLLGFAFLGSLIMFILWITPFKPLWSLMWLINYVIGIIMVIFVKWKNVRELIGCLNECYYGLLICVGFIIIRYFIGPKNTDLNRLFGFVNANILALFILYYSLYIIYKYDNSQYNKPSNESMMIDIISTDQSPDSPSISTLDHAQKKSFVDFLTTKQDYDIFAHFLSSCFCLENLLFFQKVCILRWKVMELIEYDSEQNKQMNEIYSIKFTFLDKIYTEYNNIINKYDQQDEKQVRNAIWSICFDIYNEFIQDEAINQVNIPYNARIKLDRIFKTNENMNKYESYHQFVSIFDKSVSEIWRLLSGMYGFKFVQYLQQHQSQ